MAYYHIADHAGRDFIVTVREHSRNATTRLRVKAKDETQARRSFNDDRDVSVLSVR